jgi:hypothetical protein
MRREYDFVTLTQARGSPRHYQPVGRVPHTYCVFDPEVRREMLFKFPEVSLLNKRASMNDVPKNRDVFFLACAKGTFVVKERNRAGLECCAHWLLGVI